MLFILSCNVYNETKLGSVEETQIQFEALRPTHNNIKNVRGTGTDFLPLISISYGILNGNCELYWPYTICCFFSRYDFSSLVVTNDYQGN